MLAALAMTRSSFAVQSDDDWRTVAGLALEQALHRAYPEVLDWNIEPLIARQQQERLQGAGRFDAAVTRIGKRSAVRIRAARGSRAVDTIVWFAVGGTQSVVTAKSSIDSGAVLTPELAEPAAHDILAIACTPIDSPAVLSGKPAKRRLASGDPICTQDIEPRPAVGRGEGVVFISTAGAVTITARGIAQQDARIGEVLRVKSPSSGEVFLASVRRQGEVVVND